MKKMYSCAGHACIIWTIIGFGLFGWFNASSEAALLECTDTSGPSGARVFTYRQALLRHGAPSSISSNPPMPQATAPAPAIAAK